MERVSVEEFRRRMTEQYRRFMESPEEDRIEAENRMLRQIAKQYGAHQEVRAKRYRDMIQDHINWAMGDGPIENK